MLCSSELELSYLCCKSLNDHDDSKEPHKSLTPYCYLLVVQWFAVIVSLKSNISLEMFQHSYMALVLFK